ncbi:MAG: MFS transporter [Deltaproteobacteria bacterium]|jgi:MFS family permease|nr:MFS transporter [Deltaproteobacteria bacterium]
MAPPVYTPSFYLIATANFFTVSSLGCFFLFPIFIVSHGGSKADIGIIMGATVLSSVLCRPWVSEMIDRFGRKRCYSAGCMINCLLALSYLLFDGELSAFYLPLFLVRLLHGVGLAISFTAGFTFVADIVPEQRLNEGIGMYGVTALVGMAVGPVIAEVVIGELGFGFFFLTAATMALIGFCLQLPLRESYDYHLSGSEVSFFTVLGRKKMLLVTVLALLFGFGLAASSNFVSPFAQEKNIAFISLYYVAYSSAASLTRFFGGRLADRMGEERIIPYAFIITGTGYLVLMALGGQGVLMLAGLMSGCGHGLLFPSMNAFALRHEEKGIRGKINGIFTGGIDAGVFSGSIILGYIGEWGGFQMLYLVAGAALFAGFLIFRLKPGKRSLID